MSKDKNIKAMKYIMEHSPNNNRWNNIWIDEGTSLEEFHEIRNSLMESGFSVELNKGNEDIPHNVNIIMGNALEQGLQNPIWGEVLVKIKMRRENHIVVPKFTRFAKSEDDVPKIKNRPIADWFVEDPEPSVEGKEAQMARKSDERRLKNKEALKKLRQDLKDSNIKVAVEQEKVPQPILPKTSDVENTHEGNTALQKRNHSKITRSLSR